MANICDLITIIAPTYNAAATIAETLDFILAQRGVGFEFIVSNNHSMNNTSQNVQNYVNIDPRAGSITRRS